eukprot:TRINITY_DN143_c0_g1_i1.p1 TRINITY_DN143_c0_g1~~TRINITY_DN143_c0_g1_i1.p1  ORF type:complete len:203 (-),score=54.52 TRINITY_DN143_c0_g1_i1:169-777(-)
MKGFLEFEVPNFLTTLVKNVPEMGNNRERTPLREVKDRNFLVKALDQRGNYEQRVMNLGPLGIRVLDKDTRRQLAYYPFTDIKYFQIDPKNASRWQLYHRVEKFGGKSAFEWVTFQVFEAERLQAEVLHMVNSVLRDRDLFEAEADGGEFEGARGESPVGIREQDLLGEVKQKVDGSSSQQKSDDDAFDDYFLRGRLRSNTL